MGHHAVVEALLVEGPEVNARDHDGKTALRLATDKGHARTVRVLLAVDDIEVEEEERADVVQVLRQADDALLRHAGVID